ncbi:hypothetical protein BAUCODRAFT_74513 [Baudoinia panamericana UAMH 10762]|uniref:NB-ARC domain-containing protein n=1 Tax=Baudoinia panamericana (strain UAMH 10762) TaxID=717646 RepID=M2LHX3_BAUPA|nr:uncharacterized protein BAUCODRAFT_74513 [Baudoinia panamericana UAMH 10762]EMC93782.1 hypothetical protein BAUCODRAFT_74513 [Baudoinia panamericana UAMH 10762]
MNIRYGDGKASTRERLLKKALKPKDGATQARPETLPKPSSNVPFRRDPDFVERPALIDQIRTKHSIPGGRVALVGLGGVGKSQLAVEYARQIRQQSPDTWVLWFHVSNAARFQQSLQNAAEQLELAGRKDPKADLLQLLRNWLRNENNGRWLVVLDNADDASVLLESSATSSEAHPARRPMDYFPSCDHGSMIITSRSKGEALKLVYEKDCIDVTAMSENEAESLLGSKLGYASPDGRQLVRALDCMPLAISQAAAYIRERAPRCSVQQYCELMEGSRASRTSLLRRDLHLPNRDPEASNSVLLTWQISFEHIHRVRRSAAELLSVMSFCDRLAIPELLLCAHDEKDDQPERDADFEDDILALRSFSFISNTTSPQVWTMHRLVQDATQIWLEDRKRLDKSLDDFVHRLDMSFPIGEFENWPTCQTLLPHAKCAIEQRPASGGMLLEWARVMFNSAWYAGELGKYSDALGMATSSMEVRSEQLGEEDERTLQSMAMVAESYRQLGQLAEAERLGVKVTEAFTRVLGEQYGDTLRSMGNLAATYCDQGQWAEAEQLEVEALETMKAVLGDEHPDTMNSMANLAATYRKQARLTEAEQLEVKVLETMKAVLGEEHPRTLRSVGNLATTYADQGRWAEAETLYVKVLEKMKAVLGKEHSDTLSSIANLAATYWKQGRVAETEQLEVKVLETMKAVFGEEHPHTLTSMANLAAVYSRQGRVAEAEQLGVKVLEMRKAILGDHPDTLQSMANLAFSYWSQGRMAEAEQLLGEAVERSRIMLGKNHSDTLKRKTELEWICSQKPLQNARGKAPAAQLAGHDRNSSSKEFLRGTSSDGRAARGKVVKQAPRRKRRQKSRPSGF